MTVNALYYFSLLSFRRSDPILIADLAVTAPVSTRMVELSVLAMARTDKVAERVERLLSVRTVRH